MMNRDSSLLGYPQLSPALPTGSKCMPCKVLRSLRLHDSPAKALANVSDGGVLQGAASQEGSSLCGQALIP
jgi:hypothetical protein